jgi:two-component system NtrC family response regulator
MARVLIIDDDTELCSMLTELVRSLGHEADCALTLDAGRARARSGEIDVVFLDVRLPDGSGLDMLEDIGRAEFPPEVIVMTGLGDAGGAETAIVKGAWEYVQKPLSPKKIIHSLRRVLEYRDGIRAHLAPGDSPPAADFSVLGIVGTSRAITDCLSTVAKAASTSAGVLITGETGTGKELFARAIHEKSSRRDKRFVVVDCAALPESLVESALFGHERGSFTGAVKTTPGLVELADGGTLFLDEVGELPVNVQKAFLRVLQERIFRRVGGQGELRSNFRLVAATNRNLEQLVREGRFREDLLYRLNAVGLHLPPLRQRTEDLEALAGRLLAEIQEAMEFTPKKLSPDFLAALNRYDWPGNVRELKNTLEAAVSKALYEPVLFSKHLPEYIRVVMARSQVNGAAGAVVPPAAPATAPEAPPSPLSPLSPDAELPSFKAYKQEVAAQAEQTYLRRLMKRSQGNIARACAISGLGRTRLYDLLKEHGIDRTGWSAAPDAEPAGNGR